MSDLDDTLPPLIDDEEFARRLAEAPEEEIDQITTARLLAAEEEDGESVPHAELKQQLGF